MPIRADDTENGSSLLPRWTVPPFGTCFGLPTGLTGPSSLNAGPANSRPRTPIDHIPTAVTSSSEFPVSKFGLTPIGASEVLLHSDHGHRVGSRGLLPRRGSMVHGSSRLESSLSMSVGKAAPKRCVGGAWPLLPEYHAAASQIHLGQ